MESKDFCTGFFENWYTWKFKKVYIGNLCEQHDKRCGTHGFYKDTWNARLIGAIPIATVATIACWIRYTKKMIKKV